MALVGEIDAALRSPTGGDATHEAQQVYPQEPERDALRASREHAVMGAAHPPNTRTRADAERLAREWLALPRARDARGRLIWSGTGNNVPEEASLADLIEQQWAAAYRAGCFAGVKATMENEGISDGINK
jgi:hypothetical protein